MIKIKCFFHRILEKLLLSLSFMNLVLYLSQALFWKATIASSVDPDWTTPQGAALTAPSEAV